LHIARLQFTPQKDQTEITIKLSIEDQLKEVFEGSRFVTAKGRGPPSPFGLRRMSELSTWTFVGAGRQMALSRSIEKMGR
jgi:hypothetical protein